MSPAAVGSLVAPEVSVLLPVRDGAAHLPEAIASLEGQTFQGFEVLAVDDGSTDATPEVLVAWADRDARVRVLRQEPAGIVTALEAARKLARGRYLARMDADDVCDATRLAAQRALMEADPTVVACGCGVEYFPEHSVRDGARRYEAWLNDSATPDDVERELFVECPLAHPTFFLRASAVAAVGGYRDEGWPEDYDLLLRLWAAGGRLAQVPETLLRWREGPDRLSRTDGRYAPEAFLACKVHHLRRTLLSGGGDAGGDGDGDRAERGRGSRESAGSAEASPDPRGIVVWGAGPVGKAAARAFVEAGTPLVAFVEVDPRKIGQEIHGVPVLDTDRGVEIEGSLHLAAVGQPGAREHIRGLLRAAGMRELRDFVAIA